MKILANPIKTKIMPIVAASLLTTGALTSCTTNNFNDGNNTHYTETITSLNNDLNYLNSANKTRTIEFNDYYEKSKEVINKTELNEEKLKEDNKAISKEKNIVLLIGSVMLAFMTTVLTVTTDLEDKIEKYLLGIPFAATALCLGTLGANFVNKDTNEQKYIQEAQHSLKVYKDEKLAVLESLKKEEQIKTPIKKSENK